MTIREAMRKAERLLLPSEDARFDVLCLAQAAFALNRTELRLRGDKTVEPEGFFALVQRRAAGEPLQYILGEWEFFGLRFAVGQGVLIPRPETELLAQTALEYLRGCARALVYDLCAGSGCVGLSVAHYCPQAQVKLLELSEEAMPYLRKNAAAYPNAEVVKADVLNFPTAGISCQVILANPPYVATEEIDSLSTEVRHEPRMALDGGADGLDFYRVLAEKWLPRLEKDGILACECGENQAMAVAALFAPCKTEILRDLQGIERVVIAKCASVRREKA